MKRKHEFTISKFIRTGQEMWVETRSALKTRQGKGGFALFLAGVIWGMISGWEGRGEDTDFSMQLVSGLWAVMGMGMMTNLQNHKLMYLLPIDQKESAAAQIRKMMWTMVIIWSVFLWMQVCAGLKGQDFWMNAFLKALPVSLALSSYQVASLKPAKGKQIQGSSLYHLSYFVIVSNILTACINGFVAADKWGWMQCILPVLNYGISIYTTVYLYRKIAYTDLYYDEICAG